MHRALCFLLACLVASIAGCSKTDTPTNPTPTPAPSNNVVYSALAASDGTGFGGSAPCVPFDPDCPSGTGYVYLLKRRFQADGKNVTLNNRSVPGAVLSNAILTLSRDIGRTDVPGTFIDQIAPFVPATSTHITIFAGGNDANVIAQAVRAGRGAADIRVYVDEQVRQWGTDYEDLVRRLRTRSPDARIVALNLPNLAGAPYLAGNTVVERSIVQRIAVGLSDRVNALRAQNVLVVDLMCDPRVYDPSSLGPDGFHPSDRGYSIMAELTYPPLSTGVAPAPSTTCAQRSLVPPF